VEGSCWWLLQMGGRKEEAVGPAAAVVARGDSL
jgi:hypothetical protein